MKKLIIFYSFEGNTKLIAENIANEIDAEILEIKPKEEIKTKGFMKFLWGGRDVFMKKEPGLIPIKKNIQDFDVIFIGTPVWAWTYAPPMKTFFSQTQIENKKIALFCCHGGGPGKIFDKMKLAVEGNEILGEIAFLDPTKKNTEEKIIEVRNWAKEMIDKI